LKNVLVSDLKNHNLFLDKIDEAESLLQMELPKELKRFYQEIGCGFLSLIQELLLQKTLMNHHLGLDYIHKYLALNGNLQLKSGPYFSTDLWTRFQLQISV
jgi:hypothetical protein